MITLQIGPAAIGQGIANFIMRLFIRRKCNACGMTHQQRLGIDGTCQDDFHKPYLRPKNLDEFRTWLYATPSQYNTSKQIHSTEQLRYLMSCHREHMEKKMSRRYFITADEISRRHR